LRNSFSVIWQIYSHCQTASTGYNPATLTKRLVLVRHWKHDVALSVAQLVLLKFLGFPTMPNRYSSPNISAKVPRNNSEVQAPAIALIVVATIAIFVGVLGLLGDLYLIFFGQCRKAGSHETQNDFRVYGHHHTDDLGRLPFVGVVVRPLWWDSNEPIPKL
jgi:hypothetical protein